MRTLPLLSVSGVLALSLACNNEPPKPDKPACELAGNQVAGHTFVMVDEKQSGQRSLDRRARMTFEQDGDALKMKYTVKSLVNVYDYTCSEDSGGRLRCYTTPDIDRICRSLEVFEEGSCTPDKVKELGFEVASDVFDEALKATKEEVAKMKESPQWKQYQLMYNNVGNAVQGMVVAKVNEKRCELNIDDMMIVLHDGKVKQDFNPVGANPFAKVDEELLFVDCPNDTVLADHDSAELPKDLNTLQPLTDREPGEEVHYFYLDEVALKPEEGCTYSADLYANYVPKKQGVEISANDEGKLQWNVAYAWSDEERKHLAKGKKGGVFTMVRKKTCGGETKVIDAVCNYTVF